MIARLSGYSSLVLPLWRSLCLNAFKRGVHLQLPCYVDKRCSFITRGDGTIHVGRKTWLSEGVHLCSEGKLVIEAGVFVNRDVMIVALNAIRIGSASSIAERVSIRDHDHRFSDVQKRIGDQGYDTAPINIVGDCWIGCNAVVLKGVTIGQHSVVGASAVVTRDLPPFCVAAGVPARVIRKL